MQASPSEILGSVPHVNRAAKMVRNGDGGALVEIPVRKPGFLSSMSKWVLPFSDCRRVNLDALGLDILDLCDGKRTVEGIVENFAVENRLSFREAQVPVMQFMRLLSQRGILAIAVKGGQDKA